MAVCATCRKVKTKENTNKSKHRPDGYNTFCKDCLSKRRNTVEEKQKRAVHHKEYYEKVKEKYVEQNLRTRFGLTKEDYLGMLLSQDNKCAICRRDKDEFSKRMAVDHCHNSGKNRGLLCTCCNTGLGQFKDSIEILENAINYLKEHKDGD